MLGIQIEKMGYRIVHAYICLAGRKSLKVYERLNTTTNGMALLRRVFIRYRRADGEPDTQVSMTTVGTEGGERS